MAVNEILPQIDITAPKGKVIIEIDPNRKVMYVHAEGMSVLRICRLESLAVTIHNKGGEEVVIYEA